MQKYKHRGAGVSFNNEKWGDFKDFVNLNLLFKKLSSSRPFGDISRGRQTVGKAPKIHLSSRVKQIHQWILEIKMAAKIGIA